MTELRLYLEFGEYNGCMAVECYANQQLIAVPSAETSSTVVVDVKIDLPLVLSIKVSGKNSNTDTLLQDEKIVKDKYVKIKEIHLARYKVNESVLYNLCQFIPQGGVAEKTNYLYCNGTAELDFQATDALRWHLMYNKY